MYLSSLLQKTIVISNPQGTEVCTQLQSKSTMTLSFVDSRTYSICIGDQLTVIDSWIRSQPGFVLQGDKIFRSPYDETFYTIDLTWPQYERSTSTTGAKSSLRREPLTMVKKDRLLPIKYEATQRSNWIGIMSRRTPLSEQ
jgi:hypothetical protein